MSNPYRAPATRVVSPSPSRRDWLQLVLSLLIAAFCVLQFLGMLFAVLQVVSEMGLRQAPLVTLLAMLVLPFSLFLGGVFLAFGRKLAALSFATYIGLYLIEMGLRDSFGDVLTVLLGVLFLAYSMWLWKLGKLGGWPNNSFKPNLLRSTNNMAD
ncbi:hypothetical protein ACW5F0_14465 [Luteimonas sp. A534]